MLVIDQIEASLVKQVAPMLLECSSKQHGGVALIRREIGLSIVAISSRIIRTSLVDSQLGMKGQFLTSIRRALFSIGLDFHTTSDSAVCLTAGKISNVDVGVVE